MMYVIGKNVADVAEWAKLHPNYKRDDIAPVTKPETLMDVSGATNRMALTASASGNPLYRAIIVAARRAGFEPPTPAGGFTDGEMMFIRKKTKVNPALPTAGTAGKD